MNRTLAGIPCIVESPSHYRINIPVRRGDPVISWIAFSGKAWTVCWCRRGEPLVWSSVAYASPLEVAQYLVGISTEAEARA